MDSDNPESGFKTKRSDIHKRVVSYNVVVEHFPIIFINRIDITIVNNFFDHFVITVRINTYRLCENITEGEKNLAREYFVRALLRECRRLYDIGA